jgi:hypothetical protein
VSEACVSAAGAIVYVVVGMLVFFALVSTIPVSGMTDIPHYAKTFLCAHCHPARLQLHTHVTVACVCAWSQTCLSAITSTTSRPRSTSAARHPHLHSSHN